MEDALRSLGMAPHPSSGDSGSPWQGGGEHGIMDASYYLDDLLRGMHGNLVDAGDGGGGGTRGPSHLQGYGHPVQTIPMRRPSPFGMAPPQARGVSQPVPQRLVVAPRAAPSSASDEDDSADLDMSSGRSEQTHSQSLVTHRSVRSDPGVAARGAAPRGNKRGRSALGGGDGRVGEEQSRRRQAGLAVQPRPRSSARVSWKDARQGSRERGGAGSGGELQGLEESEEERKKGKKGGSGGNREAVRKYRAKKKAQAREMELELEQLRRENAVLARRGAHQAELQREVGALRALVLQLYQRLGETPPPRLQQAAIEAAHTADSDKPTRDTEPKQPARPASPGLLPTGNSSTLANVVLGEREGRTEVPSLAQAALPDFPGSDWLAAMSAVDACQSSLTALPSAQPMGFSYQNAALLPNKSPLHSTIQEGLAFSAPAEQQDFGARFDSSD